MSKVRTTVIVEESLLEQAKRLAFDRKQTFTQFVEDALRVSVRESSKPHVPFSPIPAHGSGGQLIDLQDKELLAEIEEYHTGL